MTLQFENYHATNPHVFSGLAELALRVRATGRTQFSINALFEQLRWEHMFSTSGDDFKLNNNYRAPYARLLMQTYPELEGFFEVRGHKGQLPLKVLNDPTYNAVA